MFKEVRKKKNAISTQLAYQLLKNNKRAALAFNGEDGYPYVIPINFYFDEQLDTIYFHSSRVGQKIDLIKVNDKVCLTTWDDGYLENDDWAYHVSSCVVFGKMKLVDDELIKMEKLRKFAYKYYPDKVEADEEIKQGAAFVQMLELKIEHITGKCIHEK